MKRNQQVKRISRIMILTLLLSACSAAAAPSGAAAEVKPAAGKSYSEIKVEGVDAGELFVNEKGKLRIMTDEWEQKVYGVSGKKVVKKPKDPLVKATYNAFDFVKDKELDTAFYSVTVNKKGTAGYFTNRKKIFKYNKKGKITKVVNAAKIVGAKNVSVSKIMWVSKALVAVELLRPYKGVRGVYLIDMKKGKIVKKYSGKYTSLCGTDGKNLYVATGSIEKKTEKIVKIKASSGKKLASISTAPIRELALPQAEQNKNVEDLVKDPEELIQNRGFSTCYAEGKLYLQYLTGIYTWNGKSKDFKTVLDGRNNANYTTGQYWGNLAVIKGRIYFLAGYEDEYLGILYIYKAS